MRLSYRLIVWLIVGVTAISFLFARRQVKAEKLGLRNDLARRAEVLAEGLEEIVEPVLEKQSTETLQRLVEQFGNRERLYGVAIYSDRGKPLSVTASLAAQLSHDVPAVAQQAIAQNKSCQAYLKLGDKTLYVYALPLHRETEVVGALAVFHDTGYIEAQSSKIWRETFLRALAQVVFIVLLTLLIVRWTISRPIARTAEWMRKMRTGRELYSSPSPTR